MRIVLIAGAMEHLARQTFSLYHLYNSGCGQG
jgi:hypothetical protein